MATTTTDRTGTDQRTADRTADRSTPAGPHLDQQTAHLLIETARGAPPPPGAPPWSHRLMPASVRTTLADLGWWTNPVPQPPSGHLHQVLAVLECYGWCQSLDVSLTGRHCIRGAQQLLEKTGHVTPTARERAVDHMQTVLVHAGITMSFFTWNDLPGQQFSHVSTLIGRAAALARQNGE